MASVASPGRGAARNPVLRGSWEGGLSGLLFLQILGGRGRVFLGAQWEGKMLVGII